MLYDYYSIAVMRRFLTFILMILLICFTPSREEHHRRIHLRVDTSFTQPQRIAIAEGASRWERSTKGAIQFDVTMYQKPDNFDPVLEFLDNPGISNQNIYETDHTVFIWNADFGKLLVLETLLGFSVNGFTPGNYIALVPNRMTIPELTVAVVHELGHLLGLQHTKTIMDVDATSNCITAADMLQFCQVYNCDLETDTHPECQ